MNPESLPKSLIDTSFQVCEKLARSHYENFPIGWFIPKQKRKYVYAIYSFARTADDYSDEAEYEGQRLQKLDECENLLGLVLKGQSVGSIYEAVGDTLNSNHLPPDLLKDLLKAFRQDLVKNRYTTFEELAHYCVYSANPVGRLVLMLFGYRDPEVLEWSDKICTGIQLTNHWQDVSVDLLKNRVYIPEEDLKKFGVSYEDLFQKKTTDAFRKLMKIEVDRARHYFNQGKPLLKKLKGRLRWQVSLMWLGPMKILDKIEEMNYDVLRTRPTLSKKDLLALVPRALAGAC